MLTVGIKPRVYHQTLTQSTLKELPGKSSLCSYLLVFWQMEKQKCTEQLQHNRRPKRVGPEFAQDPSSSALEKAQASAWK